MTSTASTVTVCFDESSQSVHDASSASFVQACFLCFESGYHHLLCCFARSLSALIKLSQRPRCAACALNSFASLALVPICTTSILLGALHSPWPPHTAHHQPQRFFFLLLPSPCPCRYSPNVVIQRETVAMLANRRQSDTSHFVDWR